MTIRVKCEAELFFSVVTGPCVHRHNPILHFISPKKAQCPAVLTPHPAPHPRPSQSVTDFSLNSEHSTEMKARDSPCWVCLPVLPNPAFLWPPGGRAGLLSLGPGRPSTVTR